MASVHAGGCTMPVSLRLEMTANESVAVDTITRRAASAAARGTGSAGIVRSVPSRRERMPTM